MEIDCDGHRGGVRPDDGTLAEIAGHLHQHGMVVEGVMTHAGSVLPLPHAARHSAGGAAKTPGCH
ncbi:hypothetical protein WDV93_13775 [Pantoea ananatis]